MYKPTIVLLGAGMLALSGCASSYTNAPASAATAAEAVAVPAGTSGNSYVSDTTGSPRQMIFVNGVPMTSTGRTAYLFRSYATDPAASGDPGSNSTVSGDSSSGNSGSVSPSGGRILELIPEDETPTRNGQANFDCQDATYTILADGAAAVQLNGESILFLADDTAEYQGIYKKKRDLSDDTLKWLDFYYSLAPRERNALSMVPREFMSELPMTVRETNSPEASYLEALTEEELKLTEDLAISYFTDDSPSFEGVDQIYPLDAGDLYHNPGLESEYTPGNIIIYKVLTVRDRRDGSPFRYISIARVTKSEDWKIINSGY